MIMQFWKWMLFLVFCITIFSRKSTKQNKAKSGSRRLFIDDANT